MRTDVPLTPGLARWSGGTGIGLAQALKAEARLEGVPLRLYEPGDLLLQPESRSGDVLLMIQRSRPGLLPDCRRRRRFCRRTRPRRVRGRPVGHYGARAAHVFRGNRADPSLRAAPARLSRAARPLARICRRRPTQPLQQDPQGQPALHRNESAADARETLCRAASAGATAGGRFSARRSGSNPSRARQPYRITAGRQSRRRSIV